MQGIVIGIVITATMLVLLIFLSNRARWPLDQITYRSNCSEDELRELRHEHLLTIRRQYLVWGPPSVDPHELADARAAYPEIKRLREESDAALRKMAEEQAAQIQAANRRLQEQEALHQAEMERLRSIYAEMLKNLRTQLNLIPQDVVDALHVLGLTKDASFDDVYQCYRLLAKRHHPDTGGDAKQFIQINAAYTCVKHWIESQR